MLGARDESRRDLNEEHVQYPTAILSHLLVVERSNTELVVDVVTLSVLFRHIC